MLGVLLYVCGFLFGSFAEYVVHRWMHQHKVKARIHREHHKRNLGQGVLGEFVDYLKGGFVVFVLLFPISTGAGVAWALGAISFAAFAAFAHQLQHENPTRCFWLRMPLHYVHHKYNMWHHNFGISVDWWDRVFGTYKVMDWLGDRERAGMGRGVLEIKWV